MYTECPNCATVFKITAQQLNAAAGQVRCGRCNHIFSALGHLKESDEIVEIDTELGANVSHVSDFYEADISVRTTNSPLVSPSQSVVPDQDDASGGSGSALKDFLTEPSNAVVEIDVVEDKQQLRDQEILSELANLDSAVNAFDPNEPMSSASIKVDPKTEPNTDSAIDETFFESINQANAAVSSDIAQQQAVNHQQTHAASQMMEDSSVAAEGNAAMLIDDDAKVHASENYILEEVNNNQTERQRKWSWLATISWTMLILLLVLVLGAQLVYFNRTALVKNQAIVPYLEKMCEIVRQLTECDVPDPIDLTALELLDRDVRSHPKSENALLITATILSTAKFVQPYPRLVMSFSGLNDELIAQRPFFPKEYLSKEVDIKQGIPAGVPVRIMLEIVDPGEEAVNFEFSFE